MFPATGSPFASNEAVATVPYVVRVISTLLAGKYGEPGGTKAMPLGPTTNVRAQDSRYDVERAVAIRSKVAVVPTAAAPGDEFHAACPGES